MFLKNIVNIKKHCCVSTELCNLCCESSTLHLLYFASYVLYFSFCHIVWLSLVVLVYKFMLPPLNIEKSCDPLLDKLVT